LLKKVLKGLLVVLIVAFIGVQFVRPELTNPPIDESKTIFATGKVPPDVKVILERSCADCHSHATVWPWYSHVAPVSWLVVDDTEHGRKDLNFSVWGDYTPKRAEHKLEELCEMVKEGEMPLEKYTFLHPSAKLSDAERRRLCEWSSAWRAEILTGQ
jgi:hypothetical protein